MVSRKNLGVLLVIAGIVLLAVALTNASYIYNFTAGPVVSPIYQFVGPLLVIGIVLIAAGACLVLKK